jgi:hypothetical protein
VQTREAACKFTGEVVYRLFNKRAGQFFFLFFFALVRVDCFSPLSQALDEPTCVAEAMLWSQMTWCGRLRSTVSPKQSPPASPVRHSTMHTRGPPCAPARSYWTSTSGLPTTMPAAASVRMCPPWGRSRRVLRMAAACHAANSTMCCRTIPLSSVFFLSLISIAHANPFSQVHDCDVPLSLACSGRVQA